MPDLLCIRSRPFYSPGVYRASNEQVLCHQDFISVARVLSGFSRDFKEMGKPCIEDGIQLSIEITRPLAVKKQAADTAAERIFRPGDTLQVVSSIHNNLPLVPGAEYKTWRPGDIRTGYNGSDLGRIGVEPPTGQPLTDQEVAEFFSGKDYVFSISTTRSTEPFHASMWPIERLDWVIDTLKHSRYAADWTSDV